MAVLRAALYVDGFNLYHSIDNLKDDRLKWLSLSALGQRIIPSRSENLVSCVYFSAYANYRTKRDPSVVLRHRTYVAALQATGVEVVLGNFKRKDRQCFNCGARWVAHEEKETDVNIAVRLVADAFQDNFDVAYILTADTDLAPAMRVVRAIVDRSGRTKEVVAVFPPMPANNPRKVTRLQENSDRQIVLTTAHITNCRLPSVIAVPGGKRISCPTEYV